MRPRARELQRRQYYYPQNIQKLLMILCARWGRDTIHPNVLETMVLLWDGGCSNLILLSSTAGNTGPSDYIEKACIARVYT